MIVKIKRQDCLNTFSKFPLRGYDPAKDEEIFFYPKVYKTSGWLTLPSKTKSGLTTILATELTKLIQKMNYDKLIFLGDSTQYWISKLSLDRDDYKPLKEALAYLMAHKVGRRFNGALKVDQTDLFTFFKHFYCLTRCGGPLPYFHFTDSSQNIIGYIHYTGEVRIDALNKNTAEKFSAAVVKTQFSHVSDSKSAIRHIA